MMDLCNQAARGLSVRISCSTCGKCRVVVVCLILNSNVRIRWVRVPGLDLVVVRSAVVELWVPLKYGLGWCIDCS